MSYVTPGRPSLRPLSDPIGVAGGRGGADAKVGERTRDVICAVGDDEEIQAAYEEEPAAKVKPLPTTVPTNFEPVLRPLRNPLPVPVLVPTLRRGTRA